MATLLECGRLLDGNFSIYQLPEKRGISKLIPLLDLKHDNDQKAYRMNEEKYNIVPGGKAGEVPSGGVVPSFDGLGRFLGLSDDLGQIFYNSAKIATKEVFLNP